MRESITTRRPVIKEQAAAVDRIGIRMSLAFRFGGWSAPMLLLCTTDATEDSRSDRQRLELALSPTPAVALRRSVAPRICATRPRSRARSGRRSGRCGLTTAGSRGEAPGDRSAHEGERGAWQAGVRGLCHRPDVRVLRNRLPTVRLLHSAGELLGAAGAESPASSCPIQWHRVCLSGNN
jgi:hypothetical protein